MRTKGIHLKISPGFFLTAAALYYIGDLRLLFAVLLVDGIHELGHIAAFCILGADNLQIQLSAGGAVLHSPLLLSEAAELLAVASGPLAGLLFSILCILIHTPVSLYFAAAALLSTAFNLLPALPLDGGRILEILLSGIMSECVCRIMLRASGILSVIFIIYVGVKLHCVAAIFAAVYLAVLVNFPRMR